MPGSFRNSNTPMRDHFLLFGKLPDADIHELLNFHEKVGSLEGLAGEICEAEGQFPAEDCLQVILKRLRTLEKNLRGANRESLREIIELAENTETELWQSAEYGIEKLAGIIKSVY